MKMHLFKTAFVAGLVFGAYIFCPVAAALPGDVAGVVKDGQSGDPLPGANVYIVGTAIGAATDLNGRYTLKAVPPGTYTLRITYIGYETKEVSLTVGADGQVNMDVSLASTVVEAETVFVWGQREGQMAAINQQLTANSVMNVVAADRIQELPDQNVAESISRLPGISVRRSSGEAQKIVIRGLEPKLNAITVNGVRIPATDTEDRSVDLSMISSELLEAIEVFKAPTPDMDAEAVGGIVNLRVKKASEQRKAMLRLNSGYNRLAEDYGDYKAIGEYSRRFSNNKIGLVAGFNYERANRGSERQGASFSIADNNRPIGIRGTSLNIENTDEIRRRWGASATLDYAFSRGAIWLTNFYTTTSRNPFSIEKQYNAAGDNVRYVANYSEIDLKALSSSINGEMRLFGMDIDWTASRYNAQTNNGFESQLTFTEGSPFGSPFFNPDDPATYAPSAENNLDNTNLNDAYFRPDTTKETDYAAHLNLQLPLRLGKKVAGFLKFGGKYSRIDRKRDDYGIGEAFYYLGGSFITDAQTHASYPLILAPQTGRINVRNFIDSETASKRIVDDTFDLFPLFNRERIKNWAIEQHDTFHFERTTLVNDYDARETIAAGYVMAKLDFGQFLTIIPGVRYERSDNRYNAVWSSAWEVYGSYGEQRDTSSTQKYDHWFPHLHVRVKPLSWFDLRLSANRTIARPNFSWVSPRTRLDPSNRNLNRGNPDLKEATSWNYDVATSFYSNKIGLFTIGGFYKNLSNIFYQKSTVVYKAEDIKALGIPGDERGYPMTSFANSDKAKVWGFEIDLQTRLEFVPGLPRFLRGVVLNANFARIWSETVFPGPPQIVDSLISIRPPRSVIVRVIEPTRTGPMPGQAKYLTNFSVGYDIGGLSARLSALYQGESINSIGTIAETDAWNGDFWRWDASVKYRLSKMFSLNFNLVNISGEPDQTFFGGPDLETRLVSQTASSTQRYLTNHFNYGMTASAGIQLNY